MKPRIRSISVLLEEDRTLVRCRKGSGVNYHNVDYHYPTKATLERLSSMSSSPKYKVYIDFTDGSAYAVIERR